MVTFGGFRVKGSNLKRVTVEVEFLARLHAAEIMAERVTCVVEKLAQRAVDGCGVGGDFVHAVEGMS